jgi:hypothetical protein
MALVQSQQFTGSGLSNALGPLLFLGANATAGEALFRSTMESAKKGTA